MGILEIIFFVGTYLAFFVCVAGCVRIALKETLLKGLLELLMLVFFVVAFWLVESWANVRGPFYSYPAIFPDMVPHFPWGTIVDCPVDTGEPAHACAQTPSERISMTILLMESSLTFCIMWTGRLLLTNVLARSARPLLPVVAPFLAGLVTLAVDLILDPLLSISHHCLPVIEPTHGGLGFWLWYSEPDLANVWFDIPLFNFVAWFALPVALISLMLLLGWARNFNVWAQDTLPPIPPQTVNDALLRAFIEFVLVVIIFTAPGVKPPYKQVAMLALAVLIALSIAWPERSRFKRDNVVRWEFILPQAFFFLYPLGAFAYLILTGVYDPGEVAALVSVAIVCVGLGLYFVVSPYWKPSSSARP